MHNIINALAKEYGEGTFVDYYGLTPQEDRQENIKKFQEIRIKKYPKSKIITRVSGVKVNNQQNFDDMEKYWGDMVDQVAFVDYMPWENVYVSKNSGVQTPCSDLWRRMFIWWDGKVNPWP